MYNVPDVVVSLVALLTTVVLSGSSGTSNALPLTSRCICQLASSSYAIASRNGGGDDDDDEAYGPRTEGYEMVLSRLLAYTGKHAKPVVVTVPLKNSASATCFLVDEHRSIEIIGWEGGNNVGDDDDEVLFIDVVVVVVNTSSATVRIDTRGAVVHESDAVMRADTTVCEEVRVEECVDEFVADALLLDIDCVDDCVTSTVSEGGIDTVTPTVNELVLRFELDRVVEAVMFSRDAVAVSDNDKTFVNDFDIDISDVGRDLVLDVVTADVPDGGLVVERLYDSLTLSDVVMSFENDLVGLSRDIVTLVDGTAVCEGDKDVDELRTGVGECDGESANVEVGGSETVSLNVKLSVNDIVAAFVSEDVTFGCVPERLSSFVTEAFMLIVRLPEMVAFCDSVGDTAGVLLVRLLVTSLLTLADTDAEADLEFLFTVTVAVG